MVSFRTAWRYDAEVGGFTDEIEARVRAYVREHVPALCTSTSVLDHPSASRSHRADAPASGRLVIAVSGGGDSVALAATLCEAGLVSPARSVVAHFDHRLRSEAAAAQDLAVVQALSDRYSVPLVTGAWSEPRSGEAPARAARYAFLHRVAAEWDAAVVVTGHTEDDQVETILLNMQRGAGAYGIAGMAAERSWPLPGDGRDVRLARPLLALRREETRGYCTARGLAFADDEANEDMAFARNRVRAMLAEARENAEEARRLFLQLAQTTRVSIAALEAAAARAAPWRRAPDDDALAFDREALRRLPHELAAYAWRPALERLLTDAQEFGRAHFARLAQAPFARTGGTLEFPRGVVVTVDATAVLISIGPLEEDFIAAGWEQPLPFSGAIGRWEVEIAPACTDTALDGDGWHETALTLPSGTLLRGRRAGDRLALRPGPGHRSLQDAYVDAKVPRRRRSGAPVLASGSDVPWSPLLTVGAAARGGDGVPWVVRWRRIPASPAACGT